MLLLLFRCWQEALLELIDALVRSELPYKVDFVRLIEMLLKCSSLLVFPAEDVVPARCPVEILVGVLDLLLLLFALVQLELAHVVFQALDGVLTAVQGVCHVSSMADRLIVVILHYATGEPYIILLKLCIFDSLFLPQILKLQTIGCCKSLIC